ncbi:MAG: GNAT family N-acetyltransferase [Bacteroidetes bacterium]|nr:GNAT family N-acetyltransferase [Bacteroidota bacterium]
MLTLNFNPFPILYTERLVLRQITFEDAPQFFLLRSNKQAMQYLDRPLAKTIDDVKTLIEKIETDLKNNDGITWAISPKDQPRLIGTIGFWRVIKDHFRAEIGYMIFPDFQGKGLMQEAIGVALDYAFTTMKLHSIEANVNPKNQPSIKLLEKNHFVREAYFRENHYFDGIFLDSAIYSLLSSDH